MLFNPNALFSISPSWAIFFHMASSFAGELLGFDGEKDKQVSLAKCWVMMVKIA